MVVILRFLAVEAQNVVAAECKKNAILLGGTKNTVLKTVHYYEICL